MSADEKSKKMAQEYSAKAKEAMDKVTDEQSPEVKERVEKVRNTFDKAIDSAKDALS
ncbi:MAG TPA: hypothetical protein ACFCUY_14155 [Xenococcaceae cyanobacterium]